VPTRNVANVASVANVANMANAAVYTTSRHGKTVCFDREISKPVPLS
jgi:hypothetical protein